MNGGRTWIEMFRLAMLEMEPETLYQRANAARAAMNKRRAELEKNREETLEERWEIADALSSLKFW
jgi:hypothetical protein